MTDTELVGQFKTATSGLFFMSESDYPFEITSWPAEPGLEKLKSEAGVTADAEVQELSVDDFFRAPTREYPGQSQSVTELVARFRQLVEMIKANLTDTKVYKFGTINIPVFIVGKALSGEWIGLSTQVVET